MTKGLKFVWKEGLTLLIVGLRAYKYSSFKTTINPECWSYVGIKNASLRRR
jgi:hypothetical protein